MEDFGEEYEVSLKNARSLVKELGLGIVARGPRYQHVIRFTMKRRWGGVKKYAYQCSLGNLVEYIAQIERAGGKIVGID